MKTMPKEEDSKDYKTKQVFQHSEISRAVTLSDKVERRNTNSRKTEEDIEKDENRKYFIRQGRLFSLTTTVATVESNDKEFQKRRKGENDQVNCSKMESGDYINLDTSQNPSQDDEVVICENVKADRDQPNETEECITKLLLEDLGVLSSNFKKFGFDTDDVKKQITTNHLDK